MGRRKAPRIKDRATGRVIRGFVTFGRRASANALQDGRSAGGTFRRGHNTRHGAAAGDGFGSCHVRCSTFDPAPSWMHVRERPFNIKTKALGPSGVCMGLTWTRCHTSRQELEKQDSRFTIGRPSREMLKHLEKVIQGVLLDVGISSPQLDGGRASGRSRGPSTALGRPGSRRRVAGTSQTSQGRARGRLGGLWRRTSPRMLAESPTPSLAKAEDPSSAAVKLAQLASPQRP